MWPGHMTGFGWGGFLVGGLVMLLFWGGVIALVFFAIRGVLRSETSGVNQSRARDENQALEIAKERYARGEIDREEFQQLRQDLTK